MRSRASGYFGGMEPIPETAEVIEELDALNDTDLLTELRQRARLVRALVPDCVGISIASIEHGVTFTLVASSADIAVLDAVQYLFGGPCVDGAHIDEVITFEGEASSVDEHEWQEFARATAAHAIASTLTLPVMDGGQVVGTVNLYAASAHAFTGFHTELAVIFGAWASGAVANADLSFSTRDVARQAPQKLRDEATIEMAVGIVASSSDLSLDEARYALREAARRAGVSEVDLAATVVKAVGDGSGEGGGQS